jgi:SH3-like domain-containing protein
VNPRTQVSYRGSGLAHLLDGSQTKTVTRHFFFILIFATYFVGSSQVSAMPVFLRPESLFASGQYPQALLEKRTSDVQVQVRTRVRSRSGHWGWCAEEQLLTPLKLSKFALTKKEAQVRSSPQMDANIHETWPIGISVEVLEFRGSWFLIKRGSSTGWVLSDILGADWHAPSRGYIKTAVPLHASRFARSAQLMRLRPGTWVEILKTDSGYARLRTSGFEGEIARSAIVVREDLKPGEAVSVYAELPLHSALTPDSDITARAGLYEKLTVHDSRNLKWGLVRNTEVGPMWWPIDGDFQTAAPSPNQVSASFLTADIFSRKIFDMAASPELPNLKFVSAQGVFRTIDGITWQKLTPFKDENYPIAVARQGAIFIGPYKSLDHGESFESFLRLDRLSSALRERWKASPRSLKILAIRALDSEGQKLELSLDVGIEHPVRVQTDDQGGSWRAL